MKGKKPEELQEELPDPDEVLRTMLRTPPQPHGARPSPKPKMIRAKKKPAK